MLEQAITSVAGVVNADGKARGKAPRPVLWLEMKRRKIIGPADLTGAPDWVQPIIAAAMRLHRLARG